MSAREKPVLMSGPMVRAILAGQKTVTRRVVTGDLDFLGGAGERNNPDCWGWAFDGKQGHGYEVIGRGHTWRANHDLQSIASPYGEAGDRLWVRETWAPDPPIDDSWASTEWNGCGRRAAAVPEQFRKPEYCLYAASWTGSELRWVPSIHMYRWASRITLEVASVSVERLQDITEEQAHAEGVTPLGSSLGADQRIAGEDRGRTQGTHPYTLAYAVLWDELNADRGFGWVTNPWVWSVSFTRVKP